MTFPASLSWLSAFDSLVHGSARHDAGTLARHRAFILSKVVAGVVGLAAFPFCYAFYGMPSPADAGLTAFIVLPLFAAIDASRSGCLARAQMFSLLATIAFACGFAGITGGISSPYMALLAASLLGAALSGSIRLVLLALAASAAAMTGLALFSAPVPLELTLTPMALLVTFIELIAMACAMAAVKQPASTTEQADAHHRIVADNSADMMSLHTRSGNLLFASGGCRTMIGDVALKASALFDRVHVQDRPAFLNMFDAAAAGEARLQFRMRLGADETYSYVETRCAPVHGASQIVASTRVLADQNVDELSRLAEDAEKANLAKSRFLAHVSHELRTPLNAIIGFSEMMSGKAGIHVSDEKIAEYSGLIQDSGRHLLAVVNAILDLSKIESGSFALQPEPFQPCELAAKCVTLMEPAAVKGGVSLKITSHGALPEILADRRACKQILLNLLSNAVKFTPQGGRVDVALRCDSETVSFVVSDTGIGIDKADLPRLAQPFVQAQNTYDRQFEGTGLGLSLVKSLTELQGGRMKIASTRGKGTVVTILLPRVAFQRGTEDTKADQAPSLATHYKVAV